MVYNANSHYYINLTFIEAQLRLWLVLLVVTIAMAIVGNLQSWWSSCEGHLEIRKLRIREPFPVCYSETYYQQSVD